MLSNSYKTYSICLIFTLLLVGSQVQAQRYDIYQNKAYDISTFVLKHHSDKEYLLGEIEIYQDKNKEENPQWNKIQEELFTIGIQKIENEFDYFKIRNKVNFKKDQIAELLRLRNRGEPGNLNFDKVKIELISLLNGFGIYSINYTYEILTDRNSSHSVTASYFYLANYKTGNLTEIVENTNQKQQEWVKKLSSSKFKKLYLLQTKKLTPEEVDRIQNQKFQAEEDVDFLTRMDFSEAVVFPYFNGLMVSFSAYSVSSKMFDGDGFRILLDEDETKELLQVYPEFKAVFSTQLQFPTAQHLELLNQDEKFDLTQFVRPPNELEMLKILKPGENTKLMKIKNGNKKDLGNVYTYSKYYYFNQNQKLDSIRTKNKEDEFQLVERFYYDENKQLSAVYSPRSDTKLKLFHYTNKVQKSNEKIRISEYRDPQSNQYLELSVAKEHTAYNGLYRYIQEIELVGEPKYENRFSLRYLDGTNFCNEFHCVLYVANGRLTGVKKNKYQIFSLRVNEDNKPLEVYSDYDRNKYFFNYYPDGRIKTYQSFSSNANRMTTYTYFDNPEHPLTITDTDPDTVTEYHFEFE